MYDSAAFEPINLELGEDDAGYSGYTGFNYTVNDSEMLAFFSAIREGADDKTGKIYNVFANYTAVSQEISRNEAEKPDEDDGTTDDDGAAEETPSTAGNFWLQLASILLVVALILVLLALLLRNLWKKVRRNRPSKSQEKNMYKKRNRYIKKLHLEAGDEVEEVDAPKADESEPEAETEATDEPDEPSEPEESAPEASDSADESESSESTETPEVSDAETPAEKSETDEDKKD